MKLLKLYSDNPNFKTISFNSGLNIVVGLQSSSLSTDTYNGIGKSSSLQLIHLMLGASLDVKKYPSDAVLHSFLSDYGNFYLDLKIGSSEYTIRLNFDDQCYYLNDEKIGKNKTFLKYLSEKFINIRGENLSFKQVLNCFARRYLPGRDYYSDALQQQGRPFEDFYQKVTNLTLLGLDVTLPYKFKKVCDEIASNKKTLEALKKTNLTANESELRDLEDKLEKISKDKENFIIAKNYDELKKEADEITAKMNYLRNKIFANEKSIRSKTNTLESTVDVDLVDLQKVERIFDEAGFHFPELVHVHLKDAERFHMKVHQARKNRLQDQVLDLTATNTELNNNLCLLEESRDLILRDLDSKGALEEYNSIIERIRTIETKIADLTSFQKAVNQAEKENAKLESDKAKIKVDAVQYIEENTDRIQKIERMFRSLVLRFYEGHGGALTITNNTGQAKYLFDIVPYIQKDGSQGINEVKIFCFDMLLYLLNPKLLGFMAHDSCIFSGVDHRQTRTMFKIALEMCNENDLQYFVNINKNTYEEVLLSSQNDNVLTYGEREEIVKSTVLELFDDAPENTLFGKYFG